MENDWINLEDNCTFGEWLFWVVLPLAIGACIGCWIVGIPLW